MPISPLQSRPLPLSPLSKNQGFSGGTMSSNISGPYPRSGQSRPSLKSSTGYSLPSAPRPITRGSVFENIDIDQIGQGRMLTEGSYHNQFGAKKNLGLKGQLGKLKRAGKFSSTKNLSAGNVKQIHDLIADRMKGKAVSSRTIISRQDRLAILKESRKLVKTEGSKFTYQDRDDLKKIVDSLRKQYRDKALGRD